MRIGRIIVYSKLVWSVSRICAIRHTGAHIYDIESAPRIYVGGARHGRRSAHAVVRVGAQQRDAFDDFGCLTAPWVVASAPANFGLHSNRLQAGNFGGARKIAAFNQNTGRFIDILRNPRGAEVALDGLWALMFGNGVSLGDTNALYFAASTEGDTRRGYLDHCAIALDQRTFFTFSSR